MTTTPPASAPAQPRLAAPASAVATTSGAAFDEAIALTRRLKLPHIRRAMAEIIPIAKAQRWDPAKIVRALLTEEAAGQDAANLRTRRARAAFPTGKTFHPAKPPPIPRPLSHPGPVDRLMRPPGPAVLSCAPPWRSWRERDCLALPVHEWVRASARSSLSSACTALWSSPADAKLRYVSKTARARLPTASTLEPALWAQP